MNNRFSGLNQSEQIFDGAVQACKMLLEGMSDKQLLSILAEAQATLRDMEAA